MEEHFTSILMAIASGCFSVAAGICTLIIKRFCNRIDERFKEMGNYMKVMSGSVGELNEKIAVIITVQDWHMKEIEQIKTELRDGRNV